uniref:SH3 domain-containing protein n=1 Tax=Astatotilapia calliptera TaxID=8154 RepID=A0A3P8PTJ4_ASTCA
GVEPSKAYPVTGFVKCEHQMIIGSDGQLRNFSINTVFCFLQELSAHLISINSERKAIYVMFTTFEDIWKFTTYYKIGFLRHCMENLLLEQTFWLSSLKDDFAIEVTIQEETLNLFYRGILLQEGSLFASCSASQMFDSSTSGGDLYLEQGDIAQFEPPFLGSGWTVLCLADGARGTAPRPALEYLLLQKPLSQFGTIFMQCLLCLARGTCLAKKEYDAEGPDELSVSPGDPITIVGFLVPCFDWFMGKKEATGEIGLVRTSLVKPSTDIFLDEEDWIFSSPQEEKVIEQSIAILKKKSHNDIGHNYKLDKQSTPHYTVTKRETLEESGLAAEAKSPKLPSFVVQPVEGNKNTLIPLLSFLDGRDYKVEFGILYGLSSEKLASSTFTGHCDEDELISFLGVARETARKKHLFWSQTRLCFLLGKLCVGRSKFNQAQVYFEETLSVPREGFTDLRLLASIFSNLAATYLLQKNTESFFAVTERLVALLIGIPDCLKSLEDNSSLKYMLKKAILSHNKMAEARACLLLAKHHWTSAMGAQVVPYLERLLILCDEAQRPWRISPSHGYLALGKLYSELHRPHLSASSVRRASLLPSATLSDCLGSMVLLLDTVAEQETPVPPQMAPYLHKALTFPKLQSRERNHYQILSHQLTVCLCQLYCKHKMTGHAICHMQALINNSPSRQVCVSVSERKGFLIWLAWLYIDNSQPAVALDILESILASIPEHCVVLNMRGVALRCMGDVRRAAESYQAAIDICQEFEDMPNGAVAQANLGLLCLKAGAKTLAERHLCEAVQLFSELSEESNVENFIPVLMELGKYYVKQQQLDYGKGCYEWALLLAINANLLEYELGVTRCLCRLYECKIPNQVQWIIYSQHQVQLLRRTGYREQEGEALEAISQIYLSIGTEQAYRAALDYTKTSLGIFIDLGCKEKEAYGWLQAGKIYQLLGQIELVDIYVQAAQDVALSTGDTSFILKLLETAGDIFFDSCRDRDKAVLFYRDRALPIAVKSNSIHSRLRLCNKLTEVMFCLKLYGEAVEFAHIAADISKSLGERLNERVACHRLGSLYHCLKQCELAEHYYLKTLTLCPTPLQFDEEPLYYVRLYQTLGDIIFTDLKDPFDAAGYYHLALAAAMDLGNKKSQLQLCTQLATIYHNFIIDRERSLFFYQKARGFAAELNAKRINISPGQQYSSAQYKNIGQ